MISYELSRLNDKEFEALAAHIVQEKVGRRVERFKPGKDQGVDGRFFCSDGKEVIIQAKHWYNSGIGPLLTHLEKSEAAKVLKLKPSRYILVTSVPLSRVNKQAILKIFSPFLKSVPDILGNEDIQDFLRDHPKIVEQHHKLWLASSEVLRLILNAPIIGRSSFKVDEVVEFLPRYVATRCHQEALTRLNKAGAIIVIGEPGIGKSTLAEQLVLHYAIDGYELCFVENALSEAEAVWSKEKKQVFYFDDFLGRNYLDVIGRNHDSHVLGFMRRVGKDKLKRFILTSRTTIMRQGQSLSELFKTYNIEQKEYEVRITDLTGLDKAKILYNHIWFGNLNSEFIEQLYIDKRYGEIIRHRNFNPRLIAFITDSHKIAGVVAEKYWDYVRNTLDNPRDVWRGVFENQLDRMGRLIVSLVVFHGGQISENYLRICSERARTKEIPIPSAAEWGLMFEKSFQMTVGAIVTRMIEKYGGDAKVGLFNPSVGDFVLHRFANDVPSISSFLAILRNARVMTHFQALRKSRIVPEATFMAVVRQLCLSFWAAPSSFPEFTSILASFVVGDAPLRTELKAQLNALGACFFEIAEHSAEPEALTPFAVYAIKEGLVDPSDERSEEFAELVMERTGDDADLIELSNMIVLLDEPMHSSLTAELAKHVIDSWKDRISEEISEHDIASDYTDYEKEHHKAEEEIWSFVQEALSEYAINFDDAEIDEIVGEYDIHEHISNNRESVYSCESDNRRYGGGGSSGSEQEQIDDLFDRGA